jgi:hypothetical protein
MDTVAPSEVLESLYADVSQESSISSGMRELAKMSYQFGTSIARRKYSEDGTTPENHAALVAGSKKPPENQRTAPRYGKTARI